MRLIKTSGRPAATWVAAAAGPRSQSRPPCRTDEKEADKEDDHRRAPPLHAFDKHADALQQQQQQAPCKNQHHGARHLAVKNTHALARTTAREPQEASPRSTCSGSARRRQTPRRRARTPPRGSCARSSPARWQRQRPAAPTATRRRGARRAR